MKLTTQLCVAAIIAAGVALSNPMACWADKLTEANMTKKDFDELTKTETSVPGQRETEPPLEVHNLSDANAQAVKDAHGVKLIKGKDWKNLSPQDRDKTLRDLKKTLAANNLLFIEVPSGNVWSFDRETYYRFKRDGTIHRWDYDEIEKLPKAVKRDPLNPQEDRRTGGPIERLLDLETP